MSQRYSDNPSQTQHRTGRSNYGGGARGNRPAGGGVGRWDGGIGRWNNNNNNNSRGGRGGNGNGMGGIGGGGRGGKGPIENIGNWINERRRRHRNRHNSSNHGGHGEDSSEEGSSHHQQHNPVGTEARALQNIQRNAKNFNYPKEGFVTPIEHSLLYAMIEYPMNYPESVVREVIEEEEFEVYLYVNDDDDAKKKKKEEAKDADNYVANGEAGEEAEMGEQQQQQREEGNSNKHSDTYIQSAQNTQEQRVSYAQLSALLALSAEKNPSRPKLEKTSSKNDNSSHSNGHNGSTNSQRLSEGTSNSSTTPKLSSNTNREETIPTIGQTLCKKLLRTITAYSTKHNLSRENEIREFLSPIERQCHLKNERVALQQLLPAYLGYTISLVTGNPLPLLVGAASLVGKDPMIEENTNVSGFRGMGGRVADVETAGLLDECEWDDD